jgi:hypothetical protein
VWGPFVGLAWDGGGGRTVLFRLPPVLRHDRQFRGDPLVAQASHESLITCSHAPVGPEGFRLHRNFTIHLYQEA